MECTYTSKNGQLSFTFEYQGPKDLFLQRSVVEMHDEEKCGVCGCPNIRCEVRTTKEGHTYYEMRCQNVACGARLEFGQNKDMKNLFTKRSGHPDTNGWYIYQGDDQDRDEHAPPPRQNAPPRPSAPPAGSKFATPSGSNGTAGPKTPTPTKAEPGFVSPPANGSSTDLMSYEQAKADCREVGISEDEMKAQLKQRGQTKWNNVVCTPLVRAIIAEAQEKNVPF